MYICICIIYIYFQLHEKSDILVIYAFRFCLLFCDERSWQRRLEKSKLQGQGFWQIKGSSVYVTHSSVWKSFSSLFSCESDC